MSTVNSGRVWLGTVAGGIAATAWSMFVGMVLIGSVRYEAASKAGYFLMPPRYAAFPVFWIASLFVIAFAGAWLYASARATRGAGPGTAVKIGLLLGFAAGFPENLSIASFAPYDRVFPTLWMLDLWVGAVLATVVAAWVYKD